MEVKLYYQDYESDDKYEISQICSDLVLTTYLFGQPGKLTILLQHDDLIKVRTGGRLDLIIDGVGIFKGFIFDLSTDKTKTVKILAYDQLRYLKNKDVYINTVDDTLSNVFSTLCKRFGLVYNIVSQVPNNTLRREIHDNKSIYEIIDAAISQILIATGRLFIVRDNYGTIELVDINDLKTDFLLAEGTCITDFVYNINIDSETYNQIKLSQENKETAKRENYIVFDSNNIKKWGILQHYESMDEAATPTQIEQHADNLIKLHNKEKKKLTFNIVGNLELSAGKGLYLKVDNSLENIDQYSYIITANHYIYNDYSLTELEVMI